MRRVLFTFTLGKNNQPNKKHTIQRGHLELNQGPLDLQSNALPLSYTPLEQHLHKVIFKQSMNRAQS